LEAHYHNSNSKDITISNNKATINNKVDLINNRVVVILSNSKVDTLNSRVVAATNNREISNLVVASNRCLLIRDTCSKWAIPCRASITNSSSKDIIISSSKVDIINNSKEGITNKIMEEIKDIEIFSFMDQAYLISLLCESTYIYICMGIESVKHL